ncbi:MAG: hypothetical protein KGJ94_08295 [Xanthomonadaceae bacterium]|nr:hypothetical protein [Xanthomonadaceae bacterium]
MSIQKARLLIAMAGVLIACSAGATTYTDNFSGTTANLDWNALNDACLTAGNGTGSIPACSNMTWMNGQSYTIPADETIAGQGALLLTPPRNNQTGAILSGFPPFPLSQGIQITFTTYTYGGDSGGLAHNGADGIVFFLTDGTQTAPTTTGAEGGSMGYDCSNDNGVYDGIAHGYLGLGIDEFGNFLNSGDNGSVGIINSNAPGGTTAHGTNSYWNNGTTIYAGGGLQYQPERIGLRGAGNTNWAWLQSQNSSYYSGSSSASKVQAACRSGQYYARVPVYNKNGSVKGYTNQLANIPYNYDAIPGGYAILPNSEPISNNSKAATRNPTSTTSNANIAWPITYKLTISSGGLLNFAYSYNNGAFQPVLANADITSSNGPLPASLRFGFSAGTGGDNNVHEITCFQASPLQANSSAGSNTVTGKVTGNSQFFLASYSSDNWWGSLVADPLIIQSDGTLNIGTDANWDAKCVLTGGPCDSMGTDAAGNPTHTITGQSPSSRNLFTWNAGGVALSWNNLSTAEQTALNTNTSGTVDNNGQQRVEWLQGVRSVEQLQQPTPGNLRARTYVLGDIINSSPTFVGEPSSGALPDSFYDQLNPSASNPENANGAQSYSAFVKNNASRINVVYVGSNDGFVHGFEAGISGNGSTGATDNDGKELLGYMPQDVLLDKAVNLADPLYVHDYLVDATPAAGDVFYNKNWHTWLVGGVGSDGQEIYALDVTDPSKFTASDVIGDWDSSTLAHLGNTVGTPIIARMHNGDWAIIFGSGLHQDNSGAVINSTTAGVYIGLIDPSTGSVTFQFLDTGVGSKANPDGIAYVSQVDLDGDNIADYLYAGDTQGNVWRFDVTGNTASQWKVSTFGTGTATPLFVAKDASGNRQPITTSITILALQTGLVTRDMLYFGTGQQTQATTTKGVQYASGNSTNKTAQTFYGIWDWNMSNWNSLSTTKYASLSSGSFTRDDLLAQTLEANPSSSDTTHRYLNTTKVVCWQGDAVTTQCPTENQYGWLFDLPDPGSATGEWAGEGEQVIYNPAFIDGAVVVNTAIPPEISASQCNPGLQSGWTMAFDPSTGGGFPEGYFPDAGGGFGAFGSGSVGGTKVSGVGTPTTVQYGGKNYLVTQTVTGGAKLFPINPPTSDNPSRVSWRELVNP